MPKTFVVNNRVIGVTAAYRGQLGTVQALRNVGNATRVEVRFDNGQVFLVTKNAINLHNAQEEPAPIDDTQVLPQDGDDNMSLPSIGSSSAPSSDDTPSSQDSVSHPLYCDEPFF